MYYTDKKLQWPVRVEKPNPVFARMLQQAIGGVEGEIRVCMQYFFQAWGSRGPAKYRDMLLNTATEEISHIEFLATADAMYLENSPLTLKEEISKDPIGGAVLNGMDMRHILSTGLSAYPANANGVPFDMSHIYASGNLAGDMYCNVAAESTGRTLAARLYHATDDPGMKEMLAFNIARDTMHQEQWLAVLEELGPSHLPVPNSFPQSMENKDWNYTFVITDTHGVGNQANQPWTSGQAPDGKGQFNVKIAEPLGYIPDLGFARPDTFGEKEQSLGTPSGLKNKVKDTFSKLTTNSQS